MDIFEAVKSENVEMLTEIINKHKVSVTVTDKDGATLLMYAARKGNVKVITSFIYCAIIELGQQCPCRQRGLALLVHSFIVQ